MSERLTPERVEEIREKYEKRKYRVILRGNMIYEKRCIEEAEGVIGYLLTELTNREQEIAELREAGINWREALYQYDGKQTEKNKQKLDEARSYLVLCLARNHK